MATSHSNLSDIIKLVNDMNVPDNVIVSDTPESPSSPSDTMDRQMVKIIKTLSTITSTDDTTLPPEIVLTGLRRLPPEVRMMIFAIVVDEYEKFVYTYCYPYNVKIPALLEALRENQQLFIEASAVYSKATTFVIQWNQKKPEPRLPFEIIQKLMINLE